MIGEIRIIDLFEAVMERPYLYTLNGTCQEALAFLEGYQVGFTHHNLSVGDSSYLTDLKKYQLFKEWLADKFKSEYKSIFRSLMQDAEELCVSVLKLYRDFKASI